MGQHELSILIPARNEQWLGKTVESLLSNMRGNTEILVALDGAHAALPQDARVQVAYFPQAIGQRAATNALARLSSAKYLMKLDAHCDVAEGFDATLLADMQPDWTMVPTMKNLHVFDWECNYCGERTYQSGKPTQCTRCASVEHTQNVVWKAKKSPNSTAYCFDATPHFQYHNEFKKRKEGQGPLSETMSLQGSCWMVSRERYLSLNICDEKYGSWGSQGIEVACKTWLSGGAVKVNQRTWYAHCFRTQAGFGFPYPLSGNQVDHAKRYAREQFFYGQWGRAERPLSWLLERFWPVPGWGEADLEAQKARECVS